METRPTKAVKLFYCYAHEDRELRDALEQHLSSLRRQKQITDWHDREILPGAERQQEIDVHLNTADVILLLISPPFIASDYCYTVEMQRALERHQRGTARVIPILLRSVDWEDERFSTLQMLPTNQRAVTLWHDQDAAFTDIAKGVRRVVKELLETVQPAGSLTLVPQDSARTEEFSLSIEEKNLPGRADANRRPDIPSNLDLGLHPLRTFGGPLRIVSNVRYFPSERTVKYIQRSRYVLWKKLVLPVLLLLLVLLTTVMLSQAFFLSWWFLISLVVIGLLITMLLVVTSYLDEVYILTNRRIIEIKRHFLTYGIGVEVPYQAIGDIRTISVKVHNVIELLLNVGDLYLEGNDLYPGMIMRTVDNPFLLQDQIAWIKSHSKST